ncbi:MAG: DUF2339 domain-containing protein [Bdellovibrionota bacterium]
MTSNTLELNKLWLEQVSLFCTQVFFCHPPLQPGGNTYIGFILMTRYHDDGDFSFLFYGAPIALLGLLGGYLTPIFVGSQDSSLTTLLIYLYFLFVGFLYIILKQKWWKLLPISVISILLWVVFSIAGDSAHIYHSRVYRPSCCRFAQLR